MFWEAMDAKWGVLKPWEGASRGGISALNQKVLDKFLKVCVGGEGARQGALLQHPVNPLLPREVEHSIPPFLYQLQKI